jgi:hypothetical protein
LFTLGNLAAAYSGVSEISSSDVPVLKVLIRTLGEEHPDIMATMHNLKKTYSEPRRRGELTALLRPIFEESRNQQN